MDTQDIGTEKITYLLDGHNILYALRQAFIEQLVDGHPGTAAREELAERLRRAFARPGPAVFLYYDGGEAHAESRSAQLQVIYSGGDGEHRADRAILGHLRQLAESAPVAPVVVVTRDIALARRARKRGASIMAPEEFAELSGLLA
jgi:hypothetical protein